MPEIGRPIDILMIEDNPYDVRLTMEAFKDAKVSNNLSVASDGEEALRFLRREGEHAGSPRPDLILLDLNLPKKSHSGSRPDDLRERTGHPACLRAPCERLYNKTG
jgi:CheY-like chemotaxis protein